MKLKTDEPFVPENIRVKINKLQALLDQAADLYKNSGAPAMTCSAQGAKCRVRNLAIVVCICLEYTLLVVKLLICVPLS